jgi:subtilisin family serine protease
MSRHVGNQLAASCLFLLSLAWPGWAEDRHLVRIHPNAHTDIYSIANKYGARVARTVRQSGDDGVYVIQVPEGQPGKRIMERLQQDPAIVLAERDASVALPIVTLKKGAAPPKLNMRELLNLKKSKQKNYFSTPAWNGYTDQPAASVIGISDSHRYATGSGVVAVIDTGVDFFHPVLAAAMTWGWDFLEDTWGGLEKLDLNDQEVTPILDDQEVTPILDSGGVVILNDQEVTPILDDQEVTPILDTKVPPAFGHGTMTAGIIHLIAPTARIMPLKAFGSDGTANLSDIIAAIYWAVDHGADVISMSFDARTGSAELKKAIDYATSKGVVLVASVGNDGQDLDVYPAVYSSVLGIGSTSMKDVRSSFSNFGDTVDLAAPGEGIISTYPRGKYAAGWGTSFSAPMVAGAAALLNQLQQRLTVAQTAQALSQTDTVNSPGMGAGRLDLVQACKYVSQR